MKYRTGFVTNSSSVSFYMGRKGDRRLTEDDAFDLMKECWNDYYDCVERLIHHIYFSEADEVRQLIRVGTRGEIWGEDLIRKTYEEYAEKVLAENTTYVEFNTFRCKRKDIIECLEKQFNISFYDIASLTEYDLEEKRVIRKPWLKAETYEEALKLGIGKEDIQIFVLGDKECAASVDRYRRKEAFWERHFENREEYEKAWEELDKEEPIDFDLQLGLDNMDLVEEKEVQEECKQCQVIVETWDSHIPMGVYKRMKAKVLGAVYHGC